MRIGSVDPACNLAGTIQYLSPEQVEDGFPRRAAPILEAMSLAQRFAFYKLHGDVVMAMVESGIEDGYDVGVIHR